MSNTSYNGILAIKKPTQMTSHDVVARVRQITKQRRIGHTGTLDPLAEGLLVLCLGNATKISRYISSCDKTYVATVRLGLRSKTLDAEGLIENELPNEIPELSEKQISDILNSFVGEITLQVPLYSAVHVDGQRLYELARRGETPKLPERNVTIHEMEFLSYEKPDLQIKISCSSGTYIRTLADEIGNKIGCGAYLANLNRTVVGNMSIDQAISIEQLVEHVKKDTLSDKLIEPKELLNFTSISVNDKFSNVVHTGPSLKVSDIAEISGEFKAGEQLLLKNRHGELLAVGKAVISSDLLQYNESIDELFSYDRVLL